MFPNKMHSLCPTDVHIQVSMLKVHFNVVLHI